MDLEKEKNMEASFNTSISRKIITSLLGE